MSKLAVLLVVSLCTAGCAEHRPPKVGASPHRRYSTPFGDEQVCDGSYAYNPQTMKCEKVIGTLSPQQGVTLYCIPNTSRCVEPVPGHPGYHFGPEHLECDMQNNCETVRSWLSDKDNKPMLSPVGCWLAHTPIGWIFGDKPGMCEQKP